MEKPDKMLPDASRQESGERTFADKLLCTALDIGENILIYGGEVNRVEDTMDRICRAYGAEHTEIFAISSLITATVRLKDGSYSTQVRRVSSTECNLYRLERLNSISRKICSEQTPLDTVQELIREAKKAQPYPAWLTIPGAMIACGGFAVFFGGNIFDGIAAALIGAVLTLMDFVRFSYVNKPARAAIKSFLAGILSYLVVIVGIGSNVDKVMIGTIMLLIPGIMFGYAIRDLFFGNIITGSLKIVQSVLLAGLIAFGYFGAILIMGRFLA